MIDTLHLVLVDDNADNYGCTAVLKPNGEA